MTRLAALLLAGSVAQAAVIRGVVTDQETGRPLARAVVTLKPIQDYGAGPHSVRTNRAGEFVFSPLGAGLYLLSATRPGFAPLQYGQKDWSAAATPVPLEENGAPFLEMRMKRLGSISGVILDENEIGIPDQEVVAYKATRPLEVAGRAGTDDRGAYRIHGLEPGSYYVRNVARQLEDGTGLLPTFYKDVLPVDDARTVEVALEQQVPDINFKPQFGRLFHISGLAIATPAVPVTVTLVADTGRRSTGADSGGRFRFDELAPGMYELLATTNDRSRGLSDWQKIHLERDNDAIQMHLYRSPEVQISFEDRDGGKVDPASLTVLARRKDLAGTGEVRKLAVRSELMAGTWEIALIPPPFFYPVAIAGGGRRGTEPGRVDGWNEVTLRGGMQELKVTLSSQPAAVRGRVTASGSDAAAGAPVYLEPYDPDVGKRAGDLRAARTDAHGGYSFPGLAPGAYRLLSTFDYDNPDERAFDSARPVVVNLRAGEETRQDLSLWSR